MDIIVTTTDRIENCRISRYIGILRSSAVVGAEVALADFFADASRNYRRKLDGIYNSALQDIRLKAAAAGADAIIGLHSEFQDVFAKGKTRFVVSLIGTAVRLEQCCADGQPRQGGGVTQFDLSRNLLSVNLLRQLEKPGFNPGADDWDNIVRYALYDVAPQLYRRYLVLASETIGSSHPSEKRLLLDNFIPFLQSMDYEQAAEIVYSDTTTSPYVFRNVVKACNLFHPQKVAQMMTPKNKHTVISLLDCDKPVYDRKDLEYMSAIVEYLDNLPDTGHYEEGRDGLFSKTGTMLVCERGHMTPVQLGGHCTALVEGSGAICNLNVKGITEQEVLAINAFKDKVDILKSLLNNDSL